MCVCVCDIYIYMIYDIYYITYYVCVCLTHRIDIRNIYLWHAYAYNQHRANTNNQNTHNTQHIYLSTPLYKALYL